MVCCLANALSPDDVPTILARLWCARRARTHASWRKRGGAVCQFTYVQFSGSAKWMLQVNDAIVLVPVCRVSVPAIPYS